jgi:hypothetical protein
MGCQAEPSIRLSEPLRTHVKEERFQMVTSLRGLPVGIRNQLDTLFGGQTRGIAELGEEFQADGAAGNSTLPVRRLAAAGCSYDHCLVYYERGGGERTWKVALFRWTPTESRFEWGGSAPPGLDTIDAVLDAVMSGAITSSNTPW